MTLERTLALGLIFVGFVACCASLVVDTAGMVGVGLVASGAYLMAHVYRAEKQKPSVELHNNHHAVKPRQVL